MPSLIVTSCPNALVKARINKVAPIRIAVKRKDAKNSAKICKYIYGSTHNISNNKFAPTSAVLPQKS